MTTPPSSMVVALVGVFLLLLSVAALCDADTLLLSPPRSVAGDTKKRRCVHSRSHRMLAADCMELNLAHVPAYLRSDVEVLDLTFNRIRELDNTSFSNYESIKYLFLADNMISHVDGGAFAPLADLEILDLTLNSLHRVPEAIQDLPFLMKLYLGSNPFAGSTFSSVVFEPLPSLQTLTLENCKLRQLPNLSSLPALQFLNVSGNRIKSLDIRQVAPLCRLKQLDLRGNANLFRQEHCRCQQLAQWLSAHGTQVWPEPDVLCKDSLDNGRRVENVSLCATNETLMVWQEAEVIAQSCETEVLELGTGPLRLKSSVIWALVGVGFCLLVLVCFFSTYCFRKRKSRTRTDRSVERLTTATRS